MPPVTSVDIVLLAIDAGLWAAVLWRGVRSRVLTELWWVCVCIAVLVTLKIGVVAEPLNDATGGVRLEVLLTNVVGGIAAMLTLQWQSMVQHGSRRPGLVARMTAMGAVAVLQIALWFTAPVYDIPASAVWIPSAVWNSVPMSLSWVIFQTYLVVVIALFAWGLWPEYRALPRGHVRTSLRWMLCGAGLLIVDAAIEATLHGITLLTGTPYPEWTFGPLNLVLLTVFFLFLVAVAIPLFRRGRWRRDSEEPEQAVASLWEWIRDVPLTRGQQSVIVEPRRERLDDLILAIRDRIMQLQKYVSPADVAHASRDARRAGMWGTQFRAFVCAASLERAARRVQQGSQPVKPHADLGELGGGRTDYQEAQWLATVWAALQSHSTSATTAEQ